MEHRVVGLGSVILWPEHLQTLTLENVFTDCALVWCQECRLRAGRGFNKMNLMISSILKLLLRMLSITRGHLDPYSHASWGLLDVMLFFRIEKQDNLEFVDDLSSEHH